jgi:hypothetical protein
LNKKSENWSVLGNEKWSMFLSKTNMMQSNHLLQKAKQNKTESKSKYAPRKTHNA